MDPAAGSPTDGELVARAQRGDRDAFAALVRRHEAMAVRVASVVCGSSGAEDAAQEGFVRAYRSLHRFDTRRPFRPWLARIVANAAKNRVRGEQRYVQLASREPGPGITPDVAAESAIAAERREVLAEALGRLPERDRLVLGYRWFEDMTEREIADALGVRPGTVKSRLARAMARLRTELADREVLAHD
jgi:RNA polymerase sigma factor (sigma-70 family)